METGRSYRSPNPAHSTPPVGLWYRGVRDLPLYKFIKIACEGNLLELVISGKPSLSDLLSTWNTIFEEFIDGMQDKKGQDRVKMMTELDKLKCDYQFIQLAVKRLEFGPADWVIDLLRSRIRVTGEFNPEDQAGYFRDLQVVLNRSNRMQQQIAEMEAHLKITENKTEKSTPPNYKQFDTIIAQVSVFSKFHINRLTVMTGEFIEYYKIMRTQETAVQAQMESTKTKRHGKS